ncbi:MAG: hypothetical protein IPM79_05335 [Polyangiaceae bacterium]|nr:hypothetical protein [Polyangiaceae bacterium]
MRGPLVAGLDVSTTAAKALIVDAEGQVVSEGRATFPLSNPSPGAWEQDVALIREAALCCLAEALARLAPPERTAVRGISIAHQRETFAFVAPDGAPLAPAIVWMDSRSTPEVLEVSRQLGAERIHELSGKVPCTTPSLYKIRMLLSRLCPSIRAAPKRLVDVHALVVHALTGRFVTSTAAADPLGLIDPRTGAWQEQLCRAALVDDESLCGLAPPGSALGVVDAAASARLGLDPGVVVVAGAGDGQAAALGAGALRDGAAYLNVGTAVVAGVTGRTFRFSRAYRTLIGAAPGTFLYESDLKGGTLTLDWLADRVLGEGRFERTSARTRTLADLEHKARGLPAGANGLLVLPYWAGVMSPHWSDDASGAIIGLRPDHGPEHLYRAICEGLALEQRLVLELIERETGPITDVIAVGGAMRSDFLLGLFAAATGRPLRRSEVDETTALGAAILASAHVTGDSVEQAASRMARVTAHAERGLPEEVARYDALYEGVYRGLYAALEGTLRALARA